jgi:pyruvate-formate lyase
MGSTNVVVKTMKSMIPANSVLRLFLSYVARKVNSSSELRGQLHGTQGWLNCSIQFLTDDGGVSQTIHFRDGVVSVEAGETAKADLKVIFATREDLIEYLTASPDESYKMILRGRIRTEGKLTYLGNFDYMTSLFMARVFQKAVDDQIKDHQKESFKLAQGADTTGRQEKHRRAAGRIGCRAVDPGVKYLNDPYLPEYSLDDFPRLRQFRRDYFDTMPEISAEYGKLMTDFFLEHGYEQKISGDAWDPNERLASSFYHVMEKRRPCIRENDLIAGSYTEHPISGAVSHPYSVGPYIEGELKTISLRESNPFGVSEDAIETFRKHVMPFWKDRNLLELWRKEYDYPLGIRIHDRFFAIFFWKTVSNMELSPGYDKLLNKGLAGIRQDIETELLKGGNDLEKVNTLEAMKTAIDAVNVYVGHLREEAERLAVREYDLARRQELEGIEEILRNVPVNPPETLHEALQSLFLVHLALGLETMDDGPSLGRLDQLLQPYFEADISSLGSDVEKQEYIKKAIELIGCFFLRICSHQIVTPEIGNYQNSGSPPNTTIVVGGTDQEGEDAVNDMSYLILKVVELLGTNDPNMHVRYKLNCNSRDFLKRAADVNYLTGSTPAIHCDDAMFQALSSHKGWAFADIRGWTPTGCVEPSIPGKHAASTSSLEVNLVAPLEMAMNNGRHPLMRWDVGPRTGSVENGDFESFEDFWEALRTQTEFLFEQSVIGNNQLGEIYQRYYPGPLLSTLLEGCIESGRGHTRGGSKYNSTGVSLIGMADVVDSLMAIKKLVFDEKKLTFQHLKKAIDANYEGYEDVRAMVRSRVPKFGSGDEEVLAIARRYSSMANDYYRSMKNYRGGHYATGWWTMANHAAYGRVTGASPSGRLDGEPFTPGLTPHPEASKNLLDNLLDVARLDPKTLDNNIAFNVRITPSSQDSHEETVDRMTDYIQTFFEQGGMQIQFNVVSADTLKDAMAHPEYYPDLMVRISGYCGYFTQLQRDLQLEILRRCEYGL